MAYVMASIFDRRHLIKILVDPSSDIPPPLSIGHHPHVEVPAGPGLIRRPYTTSKTTKTYISSITDTGLSEYIADRLSMRSNAAFVEERMTIGVCMMRMKIISPKTDKQVKSVYK